MREVILSMKDITLPAGFLVRPASMADLETTTAMFNEWSKRTLGVEKFILAQQEREWKIPGFDLETDTRLVLAPEGKVAAYYEVWDLDEPHVRINCWGRVHPDFTGLGIGTHLLDWAEQRARQAVSKAPPEARVVLLAFTLSNDEIAQELFRQQGFQFVRHSLRMVIHLNGMPPEPIFPPGISVRPMLVGKDERAIVHAIRDAFRDHWGYVDHPFEEEFARWIHYMENDPSFDPTLWFVAMEGDEIVGISLCRKEINDDPQMGWVGTLGVRRPWRRRGVALALLHHSFNAFHRMGKQKVGLGVDAESLTGATKLYRKAGMESDPAWQFSLYEKELRPGIELSTQSA